MSPLRQSIHEIKGKFESYVAYYAWLPQFDVCLMVKISNLFFSSGLFIPSLSPPGSFILIIAEDSEYLVSYSKYPSIIFFLSFQSYRGSHFFLLLEGQKI